MKKYKRQLFKNYKKKKQHFNILSEQLHGKSYI